MRDIGLRRAARGAGLWCVAFVLVVGVVPVAAQGLTAGRGMTVRRDMTPRLPPGMGALAGALQGLGGNVPTEISETFFVNADGTKLRVERVDEVIIYDLNGEGTVITIDEREMTWERKSFAEYQEPFRQLTQGEAGGRGGATTGAPPPPDFEDIRDSIDVWMESQGQTEINGQRALLAHQVVSFDMSSSGQAQPGMDGTMYTALKIWFVDKSVLDLTSLNEIQRQLAVRLLGVPLGGGGQDMNSWINDPEARKLVEDFHADMAEFEGMEALVTDAKVIMVPRGQEFDRAAAFADDDATDESSEQDAGGGGGLFGALGRLAEAANQSGGGAGAGSGGQTEFGGARTVHSGYGSGAQDPVLFDAPSSSSYSQVTR